MTEYRTELRCQELVDLCILVKAMISKGKYEECREIIKQHMGQFPDAPQPHNLYGILLEKEGDHVMAMRHFRVAWSLDPTYNPSEKNMEIFSGEKSHLKEPYYDESREDQNPKQKHNLLQFPVKK